MATPTATERALVVFQAVADALPYRMFWKDPTLRYAGCNALFAADAGLTSPAQLVGRDDFDMPWPRAQSDGFRADDREVISRRARPRPGPAVGAPRSRTGMIDEGGDGSSHL